MRNAAASDGNIPSGKSQKYGTKMMAGATLGVQNEERKRITKDWGVVVIVQINKEGDTRDTTPQVKIITIP